MTDQDKTKAVLIPGPGVQISRYKIVKKLGAGGMGDVFLAEDASLRRKVALKFLSPNLASDDIFRERFMREARSAAALNHPNIITVYEVSEFAERVFIALEYIEGPSLKEIIAGKATSFETSLDLAVQICDGLEAAHNAKLIHRDIKPDNIMLDKSGRVRILDFGLVKSDGEMQLTSAGMTMGTANYMSPEQGKGIEPDQRSDIFSLGVVLYELFTGKLPFTTGNIPATLYSIVNDIPKPLSELNNGLPSGLQAIINKVLSKEQDERYQSAGELKGDLRLLANPSSITTISQHDHIQISPKVNSLAVLYLKNIGSPDDEFLSYGITEDLIVDLTRLGTFRVASMRSILKYKDSDDELDEIAAGLKSDLVLDGSIMKMGDIIRVSTQLTDVSSGENLWAERWEEPFANLPSIKQSLAEGIKNALNLGQTVFVKAQVGRPETSNAGAYENYLKAKYTFERKQEKSDIDIALGLYSLALKEEPTLLAARVGIAEIMMYNGDLTSAKIELDLALKESNNKNLVSDKVDILKLLAELNINRSQWDEAKIFMDEALEIVRRNKDLNGEATALGILIAIYQPQAEYDKVILLFDRVLEISRQLDDQEKIAEALKNMGVVYARKGDYDKALDLYDECLEIADKVDNLSLQASCNANIGNVFYFRGKYDKAFEMYEKAFVIAEQIGNQALSARQSLNMGLINLQTNKFADGLKLLNLAAEKFEALGDVGNYGLTLVNRSQAELTIGENNKAMDSANKALEIAGEINNPLIKSDALIQIGAVHFFNRDIEKAVESYQQALDIAENSNMSRNMAHIHLAMVNLCFYCKDYENCKNHANKALTVAKEIGEKTAMIMSNAGLAAIDACEGLFNTGLRQLEDAYRGIKRVGNNQKEIHLQALLGEILLKHGNSEKDSVEGKRMLLEALESAKSNNFVPEIKLISEIRDDIIKPS